MDRKEVIDYLKEFEKNYNIDYIVSFSSGLVIQEIKKSCEIIVLMLNQEQFKKLLDYGFTKEISSGGCNKITVNDKIICLEEPIKTDFDYFYEGGIYFKVYKTSKLRSLYTK